MWCRIRAAALVVGLMGMLGLPAVSAAPNPAKLEVRSSSSPGRGCKNGQDALPEECHQGASHRLLTKLMTALVVLDAKQNLNQTITVDKSDLDRVKHTHSRIRMGTKVTRRDALHLALMSSETGWPRHWRVTIRAVVAPSCEP